MIRKILRYFRLSWPDKLLLLSTFALLGIVRLAILVIPFRYLSAILGQSMRESPDVKSRETDFLHKISWAIELMGRYTPWESKCLVQAITGKILLRRRRLPNTLYLGVGNDPDKNLVAHAWLRSGTDIVTGACGRERFTVVAKFMDYYGEI